MKQELPSVKLRAFPVQLIDLGEDVILKRGRTEIRITGEGACPAVVRLLGLLHGEGMTRQKLLEHVPHPDRPAVEALVDHLLTRGILAVAEQCTEVGASESCSDIFYWHFGTTAAKVQSSLAGKRFVIAGINRISRQLATTLQAEAQGCVSVVDVPALRDQSLFGEDGSLRAELWPRALEPPRASVFDPGRVVSDGFDCVIATCSHGGSRVFGNGTSFASCKGDTSCPYLSRISWATSDLWSYLARRPVLSACGSARTAIMPTRWHTVQPRF